MSNLTKFVPETSVLKPFSLFSSLFDDKFFVDVFPRLSMEQNLTINENETNYVVSANLAGLESSDIQITVKDATVYIKGEKRVENQSLRSYQYSFSINENVDTENIEAKMKNGLLELTLPKKEVTKQEVVEIKVKNGD